MPKKSNIGQIASKRTTEAFYKEFSRFTSFTPEEAERLFPEQSDRDELTRLIEIVNSDKEDKEKQKELIDDITNVSGVVIKLVKKVTTGL